MRRAVTAAIALGLSTGAAPAAAGELYMGISAGPSGGGHSALFDSRFSARGHAAIAVVTGAEVRGFTIDVLFAGAGYTVIAAPEPADAAVMLVGVDLGRRVWLSSRVALGASVGLHAAQILPWTDDDPIPEKLRASGPSWALGARVEYVLGRLHPPAANYRGPIDFLSASLVLEARRERMFLSSDDDDGFHAEPTIMLVTAGLRFGMTM
jgi:hypothetical protein